MGFDDLLEKWPLEVSQIRVLKCQSIYRLVIQKFTSIIRLVIFLVAFGNILSNRKKDTLVLSNDSLERYSRDLQRLSLTFIDRNKLIK